MSQGFQERVAELELVSQRQAENLRNFKEIATIKGRTLDIILAKIKETRERVDKMSTAFTGQLQLKQNSTSMSPPSLATERSLLALASLSFVLLLLLLKSPLGRDCEGG